MASPPHPPLWQRGLEMEGRGGTRIRSLNMGGAWRDTAKRIEFQREVEGGKTERSGGILAEPEGGAGSAGAEAKIRQSAGGRDRPRTDARGSPGSGRDCAGAGGPGAVSVPHQLECVRAEPRHASADDQGPEPGRPG